jgi:hypothetical protein
VLTSDSNGNATWQSPTTSKDAQTLALSGSSLSISNGNSVTLPDTSSTNELQTLSLSGNSLTLSNGGGTVPLPSAAGTVTQIATGTGLTGGPITSTGTISLADSGAASGTYGSGSAVPVINVDSKGRIKGVSTTPVSNLYNSDGTLSGGRTVTLGGSDLVLSGSTGDLIFASDLIKVYGGRSIEFGADIATKEPNAGKVYYNASGNSTLDITGAGTPNVPRVVRILDNLVVSNSLTVPSVKITSGGPGVGKVLTSDASGNATWQTIAAGTGTQTLSLSGSTLSISNGNSVILPDTSSTNELQTLSLSGNSLTLSNGGGTVTLSSGTVTQIATGTGLTGGPITSTGTISLADSGASAGTYGSGSAVPVVNVDSKGRLTAVSTMPVSNLYNADGMLSSSRIVTMGNHNLSLNGTGNFVFNATSLKMNGSRIMEFGAGIEGKDPFAGMIAYNAFNSNALDIVGAGAISGKRRVRIWDLIETSGLNTHNLTATGLVSATALTVNGIPINGSNLYNSDGTLSSGRTITMGANNLSLVGTGNFVFNAASVKMNGSRFMEFGTGVAGKDGNAGIIGYQVFGKLNALDIVGAGAVSGQRRIKLWDLVETDGLTTAHLTTHNLTATGLVTAPGMWVNGTLTTANLTTHNLTATGLITAPGMWVNGTLTTAHLTTHNLTATGLVSVAALTVNGRQVDGSNLYNSNGSLTGTRAVNFNGNNLLFQGSGRIGIGTHITSPRAPLHVDIGSYDGYISATNHYIDPSIIGGPNNLHNPYHTAITAPWINGNQAVSIFARGHIITESSISCVTGLVWSDERLKVIKGVSDKEKDLGLLKQIQITEYQMKDQVQHGRTVQKKVIAQQVEKILPCAVTLSTQFVPDIYQQGTIRENQVTVAGAIHVKAGDLVRIHVEKDGHEEKLELRASSAGKESFTVESREKLNGKVFVYGVERRDVRSVDYDAIAMLNVSATQELAKQQEATTRELAAVRADRDKLAAKVEAQTTRVEAQAREIDALKKQQAAEIAQINAALEVLSKLVEMKVTDKAAKVVSTKAR